MDQLDTGAGVLPDNSATAGTPPTGDVSVTPPNEDLTLTPPPLDEGKTISEQTVEPPKEEDSELSDDLKSEMESVIEAKDNDSALVKKLRDLVKTKYEDYEAKVKPAELPESQKEALELIEGIFEFDIESGRPTTRTFAEKLSKKDMNLAAQALEDLSMVPVDERGFTLGHKFLEKIGLDPLKLDDLRRFSRGEVDPVDYGMVKVHDKVPRELSEAYKSLSHINRTDVDIYLDSEDQMKVSAALQTLRNQQTVIDNTKAQAEFQERQQLQFNNDVAAAMETDLTSTYNGVLETLKTNPAYVNVALSSDKNVDSMVKDSLIAQLNSLGDPRSVLAQQAVKTFESRGVKIDIPQIEGLMRTIENSTQTAIAAEKLGKLQGRDYSTQIQEAYARKVAAVSKLTALGNKYFSQAMANLSGVSLKQPDPKSGVPPLTGQNVPPGEATPGKAKTFAELDADVLNIAAALRANQ